MRNWLRNQQLGGTTGALSDMRVLILTVIVAVFIVPVSDILRRTGWNGWLSLLWLIAGVNIF
jgi:hypothetical protein